MASYEHFCTVISEQTDGMVLIVERLQIAIHFTLVTSVTLPYLNIRFCEPLSPLAEAIYIL